MSASDANSDGAAHFPGRSTSALFPVGLPSVSSVVETGMGGALHPTSTTIAKPTRIRQGSRIEKRRESEAVGTAVVMAIYRGSLER
ncbi:MAG TPA: hypothetical protein VKU82_09845 [Planctomycetaceae bacterium]|nr:hypothetical protein [Planctomycetaceae bacterium]